MSLNILTNLSNYHCKHLWYLFSAECLDNYELRNINEDEGVMAQIRTQRTAETANIMATVTKEYFPVMDSPAFVRTKSA
jgi:hypothetical protein